MCNDIEVTSVLHIYEYNSVQLIHINSGDTTSFFCVCTLHTMYIGVRQPLAIVPTLVCGYYVSGIWAGSKNKNTFLNMRKKFALIH